MTAGFFVTGTDTGVGKTLVACALLHAFAAKGKSAIGMKPVAAGMEGGSYADVDALIAASSVCVERHWVNPYAFAAPIAPHIAAEQQRLEIRLDTIVEAYRMLARQADVVVVEGAGGFMIPLNARETGADLARRLALPVVLVVGMRLGCLNHALLTRRAIADHGLACAGWVANCMPPEMACVGENIRALSQRIDAPLLGTLAPLEAALPAAAAALLDIGAMAGGAL
jgi:dethiobiotin synthetase